MISDKLSELLCLASLLLFIVLLNEFYFKILHTRINISNTNCNFNTLLSSKSIKNLEVHVRPTLFQQIHEAGAVTFTLHQKLKFVRDGKLVIVNGEEALLVSHLSALSYVSADDADVTSFQGLSIEGEGSKKIKTSMASLKDAQRVVQEGVALGWGQLIQLPKNKYKEGLGFAPSEGKAKWYL
ncbi:hypothetical protein QL285_020682 [Trifolium repens]|nr:hypothetical protein QL285_020682 [Trifolium repens]